MRTAARSAPGRCRDGSAQHHIRDRDAVLLAAASGSGGTGEPCRSRDASQRHVRAERRWPHRCTVDRLGDQRRQLGQPAVGSTIPYHSTRARPPTGKAPRPPAVDLEKALGLAEVARYRRDHRATASGARCRPGRRASMCQPAGIGPAPVGIDPGHRAQAPRTDARSDRAQRRPAAGRPRSSASGRAPVGHRVMPLARSRAARPRSAAARPGSG